MQYILLKIAVAIVVMAGCSGSMRVNAPASIDLVTPMPGVSVSVENRPYYISGTTIDELRAQLDQQGPGDYDAHTEWRVNWLYPYDLTNTSCTTGPIQVSVKVVFTLPQWDAPGNADADLVDRWDAYQITLQQHEDGHKALAIEAGNEVLRTLQALPAYPTCEGLEQAAESAAESAIDRYRQKEQLYDQATDHGATQGARFP